jgi:hypothetical protein
MTSILKDLSLNIYLKEHRLRYQQEQSQRYFNSLRYFKSFYGNINDLSIAYNEFLNNEIEKSFNYNAPKIEDNYRRNYYQGETSKTTALTFYLYYKTCGLTRMFSKVLRSAHTKPQI